MASRAARVRYSSTGRLPARHLRQPDGRSLSARSKRDGEPLASCDAGDAGPLVHEPGEPQRIERFARTERDPASPPDPALEEPIRVLHQDAVHEPGVDVGPSPA